MRDASQTEALEDANRHVALLESRVADALKFARPSPVADVRASLEAVSGGDTPALTDERFQSLVLGCTLEDQKSLRSRLQELLTRAEDVEKRVAALPAEEAARRRAAYDEEEARRKAEAAAAAAAADAEAAQAASSAAQAASDAADADDESLPAVAAADSSQHAAGVHEDAAAGSSTTTRRNSKAPPASAKAAPTAAAQQQHQQQHERHKRRHGRHGGHPQQQAQQPPPYYTLEEGDDFADPYGDAQQGELAALQPLSVADRLGAARGGSNVPVARMPASAAPFGGARYSGFPPQGISRQPSFERGGGGDAFADFFGIPVRQQQPPLPRRAARPPAVPAYYPAWPPAQQPAPRHHPFYGMMGPGGGGSGLFW
jgi:hypothetical protein